MFSADHVYSKNQPAIYPLSFDKKKIETVIDGCHVTMNSPENTDGSSLETVRSILKSAYLNSLMD